MSALKVSTEPLLDEPVLNSIELDRLAGLFRGVGASRAIVLDIPVRRVVAVHRSYFLGGSWRTAAAALDLAEDKGWTPDHLDLFDHPMIAATWPSDCKSPFRLYCYGGLCAEDNANHRVVLGRCWLLSWQGSDAQLREVATKLVPVDRGRILDIRRLMQEHAGHAVHVVEDGTHYEPFRCWLRIRGRKRTAYYKFSSSPSAGPFVLLGSTEKTTLLGQRWVDGDAGVASTERIRGSDFEKKPWIEIPPPVLNAWSHPDAWFESAWRNAAAPEASANYEPLPSSRHGN